MQFASIDFETANSSRSSACQLGIALVDNGRVQKTHSWLIRPEPAVFDPRCVSIHGITKVRVQDAPSFAQIWPEVCDLIGDAVLVAHHAAFDMSVLIESLKHNGLAIPTKRYLCTMKLAQSRWCFPSVSLGFLAPALGIELRHHDAESDAIACAKVLLKASTECGASTLEEFLTRNDAQLGILDAGQSSRPPRCGTSKKHKQSIEEYFDGRLTELKGTTVSTTGHFEYGLSRDQFRRLVESAGGIFHPTPRTSTQLFVIGNTEAATAAYGREMTTKHETAVRFFQRDTGIQIVSAADFLRILINQNSK
jgi:DNA polymerase-3 subunit epsilon